MNKRDAISPVGVEVDPHIQTLDDIAREQLRLGTRLLDQVAVQRQEKQELCFALKSKDTEIQRLSTLLSKQQQQTVSLVCFLLSNILLLQVACTGVCNR